jgi:hypothetical protein
LVREVCVAIAASVLVGVFGIKPRRYGFWRGWIPRGFYVGVGGLLVVNAGAGALGVALAALLGWDPFPGEWALNGLVFAAAGQALMRVELRGFGLDDAADPGRSLLIGAAGFIADALANASKRRIQARLDGLSDAEVFNLAFYLYGRYIAGDKTVPSESKALVKQEVVEAGEQLGKVNERAEGRGSLEGFCLDQAVHFELLPTDLSQRGL